MNNKWMMGLSVFTFALSLSAQAQIGASTLVKGQVREGVPLSGTEGTPETTEAKASAEAQAAAAAAAAAQAPAADSGAIIPEVAQLAASALNPGKLAPCAILDDFNGKVQVLNPTRDHLLDTDVRAGIPCGAWISVEEGWARIIHRDGYRVTIGNATFAEVTDDQDDNGNSTKDHMVLYRGQIKVQAGAGVSSGEIRVVSPHARMRLKRGRAIMIFNKLEDETQVVSLEQVASLENRFESSKKVAIREGESSSLNFKALRVVPSLPQAVSIASLHQKMGELKIDERTQNEAIQSARSRQNRKFASVLVGSGGGDRKPAGLVFQKDQYKPHPPTAQDEKAQKAWVKRLTGGTRDGERILNPDEFYGHGSNVQVTVTDPSQSRNPSSSQGKESKVMTAEKARLIKELSEIRSD